MVTKVSSIFFDKWLLASNMLPELLISERYPSSNSATFKWMSPIFKLASEMAILPSWMSNDTVSSINVGNASQIRTNAGNTLLANSVREEVGNAEKREYQLIWIKIDELMEGIDNMRWKCVRRSYSTSIFNIMFPISLFFLWKVQFLNSQRTLEYEKILFLFDH